MLLLSQLFVTAQKKYYLSSSTGSDTNNGAINAPWKTLSKINTITLSSADAVYFKKGDRFDGHFVVNGSGTLANPILISSYGNGNKPIISGMVGTNGNGDYQEAVLVQNNDNIIFDGLEIQNERKISRAGIGDKLAYGIQILNDGTRTLKNFIFRNLTVQNVYAVTPIVNAADFDGLEVAGIRVFSSQNTLNKQRNIQDVVVEDCYFTNLQRFGVHFKQGGNTADVTDDFINRIANVICRNNTFYYLGGTSILPQRTYNCLIENNIFDHPGASTDPRMPGRGSSVWTFYCINTVIQYNQCISTRGYFDSHGIHIDHHNKYTFVQYNYMEDCEGGFVEILKGNENAVYRFNVSVNDGWRNGGGAEGTWANSNHTLWISNNTNPDATQNPEFSSDSYIYNNTVILDYKNIDNPNKKETTAIEINAKSTYIFNNIFYSVNGGQIGKQNVVLNTNNDTRLIKNNLFFGAVDNRFTTLDSNPVKANPLFNTTGTYKFQYQLLANSPAINKGAAITGPAVPGAGTGIFANIPAYPNVDFYGNPIDLSKGTPNIGACNAKNGEIILSTHQLQLNQEDDWTVYPNPVKSTFFLKSKTSITTNISISIANFSGQVVYEIQQIEPQNSHLFSIELPTSISKGNYVLIIKKGDKKYQKKLIIE
ncbi:T9SS type A sorting domain-containing protein [Flavobacterium sp.]|uniref:T9SS type A sorting domain-containing protein n=1 Tax=Flavobacterium sp. TaxID=239 RepID=UPI003C56DBBB